MSAENGLQALEPGEPVLVSVLRHPGPFLPAQALTGPHRDRALPANGSQ